MAPKSKASKDVKEEEKEPEASAAAEETPDVSEKKEVALLKPVPKPDEGPQAEARGDQR